MELSKTEVASQRLCAQLLQPTPGTTAIRVVHRLVGIQAQDCSGAKWSAGIRMPESGTGQIDKAIEEGRIARTWAFRGTLHLLAAHDRPWILALLAPYIIGANRRRYRQLELDEPTLSRSNRIISRALEKEQHALPRSQIRSILEREGIRGEGQRTPYMLQRAALEGLICLGPDMGRESSYQLSPEPPSSPLTPEPEQALPLLVERYLSGHGPAQIRDFAWWSGLPLSAARKAFAEISLQACRCSDRELWDLPNREQETKSKTGDSALLLPPFDEYLLGYKDRSAILPAAFSKRVNAGGGMLKPTVALNGQIVGLWKRSVTSKKMCLSIEPFGELSREQYGAVELAAKRYGMFSGTTVELTRSVSRWTD